METPYHLCLDTLANELRMNILHILEHTPMCVEELAEKLSVERSTISHALKMLKGCSIVEMKRQGRKNIYHLRNKEILGGNDSIFRILNNHTLRYCAVCTKQKN